MASRCPSGLEYEGFGYGGGSDTRVFFPARPEAGGGMKRSMTETERVLLLQLQQQQRLQRHQLQMELQHERFARSVKQRTHLALPSPPIEFSSPSSSTTMLSSMTTASTLTSSLVTGFTCRPELPFSATAAVPRASWIGAENKPSAVVLNSTMKNQLEEIERRLLFDDEGDDGNEESALTGAEWSEEVEHRINQRKVAPPPPAVSANAATIPLSPSPTNSTSSCSTVSSTASCSPNSWTATPSSRQMLLDAATAIADGNLEAATASINVLKGTGNPRGDPEQRLAAMMVSALVSRIDSPSSFPVAELRSPEHFVATQMLYDLSPCFKLAFFAANYTILDATKDQRSIHILDFEVGQGGHYAVLLHALADRQRHHASAIPPPSVKITAVADPTSPFTNTNNGGLRAVGDRIEKLAERARLAVRFNVVSRRASELDAATLGCEPGEALAVNLPFVLSRVADESVSPENPRDELLRRVRALRPRVVVLVEQDINTNTAPFAGRFAEACGHYGALLQSLDATVGRDTAERGRVEGGLVRKVINSVAREGADRVERCEVFGKWRARMGMAGFSPVALGPIVTDQVKARVASAVRLNSSFTMEEDLGGPAVGLGFGWMDRVLTVASAWRGAEEK